MKKIIKWLRSLYISKKILGCNHEWKEFGESNSSFEDKVFYCKYCGKLGFPKL